MHLPPTAWLVIFVQPVSTYGAWYSRSIQYMMENEWLTEWIQDEDGKDNLPVLHESEVGNLRYYFSCSSWEEHFPSCWVRMEMQTGVRTLVLHFHKIHLNKHVPACHSSLNLECNTTIVKKHWGNFTGSSTKSDFDGGFTYQHVFLKRDALVIINQILNHTLREVS